MQGTKVTRLEITLSSVFFTGQINKHAAYNTAQGRHCYHFKI
jgi:hypothetical protein